MKKIAWFLAVILLISLFAGCGSQTEKPDTETQTENGSTAAETPNDAAETETETETETSGAARDDLVLSTNMVVTTVDPWDVSSFQNSVIRHQLYEPLFYYNDITKEFDPKLAETYEVSEDGLTYTFHLRAGVKFHNGEEMKASDVVYSLKRGMAAPSLATYTSNWEDVIAVDDSTVELKLNAASMVTLLNLNHVYIVSEKAAEEAGDQLGSTVVLCGTGPYYLTEYNPDVQLVMEAFPDYYLGEAAIKHVTFKPIVDSSTGLIAFQNGEIDFYSIPTANWAEISESGKYNCELVAQNHITYFSVNYDGVLADANIRKAIGYCIDKEAMNIGAYDGYATIAPGMLNSNYVLGAPDDPIEYEYNPEKAKTLLAEAGYADGLDVGKILTISGGYFEKMALILQQSLAQVGIKTELDSMEQGAALAQMATGDFDILVCGYGCSYDYDFWKVMTDGVVGDSGMFVKLGRADESLGLHAQEIHELYLEAETEQDQTKRNELYKQIDDLLMETGCFYPVFYRTSPYAWAKDLNAVMRPSYYHIYEWSWNS